MKPNEIDLAASRGRALEEIREIAEGYIYTGGEAIDRIKTIRRILRAQAEEEKKIGEGRNDAE